MANHFSSIGFRVNSSEDIAPLIESVIGDSETIDIESGRYLRWASSQCGAELWVNVDDSNELVGFNPHFSGEALMPVGLIGRLTRPDSADLEGAFYAEANPGENDPNKGDYPFVFDVPDFRCNDDILLPVVLKAQIAAFAHEVSVFDSAEAFAASQTRKVKLASKSFIPSGLFFPKGGRPEPPKSEAILTGHILEAETRTNELTNENFFYTLVDTFGGIFDVVIDPELVEAPPKVGGILSGSFWLSGRIIRT